ncbi:hypothetical protein [Globicatella sanguinis]|uniref:hypothetical protein n=1 Tax=Globicatella sanguinis TaxID=13076 RepID=UPI00082509E9|nr:hypothetical protein [Globicatella sanguinis]
MEGLPKKLSDINVEIIGVKEYHDKYQYLMEDNHFLNFNKPVKHTKIYDMSHYAYGALFYQRFSNVANNLVIFI